MKNCVFRLILTELFTLLHCFTFQKLSNKSHPLPNRLFEIVYNIHRLCMFYFNIGFCKKANMQKIAEMQKIAHFDLFFPNFYHIPHAQCGQTERQGRNLNVDQFKNGFLQKISREIQRNFCIMTFDSYREISRIFMKFHEILGTFKKF